MCSIVVTSWSGAKEYEVEHGQCKLEENNEYKNVTLSKA
jgi:hypothetical protein